MEFSGLLTVNFPAPRDLTFDKERGRIRSAPTNLESTEILLPISLWNLWFRVYPHSQLVEIIGSYTAVQQALTEMFTDSSRELAPAM